MVESGAVKVRSTFQVNTTPMMSVSFLTLTFVAQGMNSKMNSIESCVAPDDHDGKSPDNQKLNTIKHIHMLRRIIIGHRV